MGLKKAKLTVHSEAADNVAQQAQIRWLIRRDMDEVLAIERSSFEFPWTEEEFLCCLRQRNCIGTVAELDHEIVGFMIYELHQSMLRILNFAVSPNLRRQGVAPKWCNAWLTNCHNSDVEKSCSKCAKPTWMLSCFSQTVASEHFLCFATTTTIR